ncbi:MAG: hypothetical protein HQL33_06630 [Alphaproteobacteria bacterium]|nr:hypothetical protein [Alphaproteobacteria bacterium]
MRGLDPRINAVQPERPLDFLDLWRRGTAWMPGTRPGMTDNVLKHKRFPPPWIPGRAKAFSFGVVLLLRAAVMVLAAWGLAYPEARAADIEVADPAPIVWTGIDHELGAALSTARQRALGKAQARFNQVMTTISGRVEHDFIPWYASFGRRKIEELQAYNHFAADKARQLLTGEIRDSGTPALKATFEHEFSLRVLKPAETREAFRVLARDAWTDYAAALNDELRRIQRQHDIPFEVWTRHLETLPALAYTDGDGRLVTVPFGGLAEPGPVGGELASIIGRRLIDRFERLPTITEHGSLATPDGTSIFAVGQSALLYFGSYVLYWIVLFFLVQSGLIPINLSGALIGWIVWEIFAWGSWIGYEALGFQETHAVLVSTIQAHTDAFLSQARTFIGDFGDTGPFRVLHQIERSLPPP